MLKAKVLFIVVLSSVFVFSLTSLVSARKLTRQERIDYAQSNIIFYVPCDSEADCEPEEPEYSDIPEIVDDTIDEEGREDAGDSGSDDSNDTDTSNASGPNGINTSLDVIKPCPSSVKTRTHTGNTYKYNFNGTTYNIANTYLDLKSYMDYLSSRHIAQDGKTCDPGTGRCYSGGSYNDYGNCLSIAGVMVGNLQTGNCTATDYGFSKYKGSVDLHKPTTSTNKRDILQKIYDAIMSGKSVLVKVRSGSSRHFAAAVGVRANANRNNITDSDILYLDTNSKLKNTRDLFPQEGKYWIKIPTVTK
ncbi:hypothetical protein IKG20_02490 [Candidatus Saccharibacteria bacterium]|nr:hypothetical protein [Candidatus Saccharibacteria bacterium]